MDNDILRMSARDIERYETLKRLLRGAINATEAAKLLHLSVRQVKRLKKAVRKKKAKGVIHKSRGRKSHNRIKNKERKKIVKLVKNHYLDFTPTFAAEKLAEEHGIRHDPKTIEAIMVEAKVWKKDKVRNKETHRAWRERRVAYGEMQQFDGCYHHWFEDRNDTGEVCLLASIDDAKGEITQAEFAEHEGLVPVCAFWEGYLDKNGKPISVYLDKFSTYHMNSGLATENSDTKTQFGRAMEEVQITVITAHSPEAKGRIERLFRTLQDRLVKELRLRNISDVKTANKFLAEEFIPAFNNKFGVEARSKADVHRPLGEKEKNKLPAIFCRNEERVVRSDWTISYQNKWYQLLEQQPVTVQKKDEVIVEERRDNTINIRLRGKYLNYKVLPARPERASQKSKQWILPAITRTPVQPATNHPWRLQIKATTQSKLIQV